MKLSKILLFFACAAIFVCMRASAATEDEPIPDFGPEGPVGYEPSDTQGGFAEQPARWSQTQGSGRSLMWLRSALRQLDLNSGQQSAIREIVESVVEEGARVQSEMARMQDTMRAARMSGGNESVVKNTRKAMMELSQKARSLQAHLRQSISEVLTEEQLAKFNQIQETRRELVNRRGKS